jgi:hypothetical protein
MVNLQNRGTVKFLMRLCVQIRYEDEDEDEGPQPDSTLEQGLPIPVRLQGSFPPELASTPLEDIDPFYSNQRVRVWYERSGLNVD